MKNKIILIAIICLLLCGCSGSWDGSDTAQKDNKIGADFERIPESENLYYNKETRVVYWIGGSYTKNMIGNDYTTSYMSVYYSSRGKVYVFKDNKMQEIE